MFKLFYSNLSWLFCSFSLVLFLPVVLDLASQVRDVVLVMCIFCSGKPQGARILERGVYGEGDGNGEISL
jgi:hypothetical protein